MLLLEVHRKNWKKVRNDVILRAHLGKMSAHYNTPSLISKEEKENLFGCVYSRQMCRCVRDSGRWDSGGGWRGDVLGSVGRFYLVDRDSLEAQLTYRMNVFRVRRRILKGRW